MSTAENVAHFGINFDLSLSHTHGGQQEANEKTNIVWCDDNLPNHREGRDYIERSDHFRRSHRTVLLGIAHFTQKKKNEFGAGRKYLAPGN